MSEIPAAENAVPIPAEGAGRPGAPRDSAAHAVLVATGILLSRVAGLVRQRVFAHYFAAGAEADAFVVASRMPNALQNLFGEGVLSASFIPVYASLVAKGDRDEARRVAGGIFAILALAMAILVLAGELLAPLLVRVFSAGFTGEKRALTILLVRIFFPASALLVLSAWCLGILNSHHRFFLSYAAPVVWNATIIATLSIFGGSSDLPRLAMLAAWGAVVGSGLQFLVQLPVVLTVLGRFTVSLRRRAVGTAEVVRNFVPALFGRGVAQISAYADMFLASFLVTGSVAVLGYAQTLYVLPVSLFGMSISAAELPAMSSVVGERSEVAAMLRQRLAAAKRRVAFFVVPSVAAFVALGDVLADIVYRSGDFGAAEADWVWAILAGAGIGLLAATLGRLYSSTLYALRDTRTPLRFATVRVALGVALGALASLVLPRALGIDPRWAVAGLTTASGLAAWVEYTLLRRAVRGRVGDATIPASTLARLWGSAAAAAAAGWGTRFLVTDRHPLVGGLACIAVFGATYLAATTLSGVGETRILLDRIRRRMAPRRR